ncbi:MAG: DUF6948 domain-containing protein [Planctomycetota bacterium]|jgi:hypothetical protein
MPKTGKYVVVTTDHNRRGVFGGLLASYDKNTGRIELTEARNCLYWSKETHGVLGLASCGPQVGSRIGPAVSRIYLDGVTAVMEATAEARAAWEAEPWSG